MNKIKQELGKQLGILRLQKNLSIYRVAKEIKLPISTIDRLETTGQVSLKKYQKLLDYFNYKIGIIPK
ncbi:MAG: helix-turn-helix domain-containing protein [Alphaproteobacteria bacterium]|nr:helix-turn-helix domain-containing protein [Alphaproteobacteria bacterium]MBQ8677904.1 helix-turn-helix domain-containing protein [Alphaproteobacteria bacterium]